MARESAARRQEEQLEDLEGLQERLSRQIEEARHRIAEQLDDMRDRLDDVRTRASDAWLDGLDYARERPTQVALTALGIGAAIGVAIYLLRSRQPGIEDY